MRSNLVLKRNGSGQTTLELESSDFELVVHVYSDLGAGARRAVIRSLFVQLKPWIRKFRGAAITHNQCGVVLSGRAKERGFKSIQMESITEEPGRLGFEIRMKRMNSGLTQEELARKLGITRPHLSLIERCLHRPRPRTRRAIERYLAPKKG